MGARMVVGKDACDGKGTTCARRSEHAVAWDECRHQHDLRPVGRRSPVALRMCVLRRQAMLTKTARRRRLLRKARGRCCCQASKLPTQGRIPRSGRTLSKSVYNWTLELNPPSTW